MLTSLISATALLAAGAQQASPVSLTLPLGARPEFHVLVQSIQGALASKDFAAAEKLSGGLPKSSFTLGWNETAVPENLRPDVDRMRDLVVQAWERIPNLQIKIASEGDLNIRFVQCLPPDAAGLPMASLLSFGSSPRLNVQIGLTRGTPAQSIIPSDAYVEVGHAIGAYLGNADDSLPGTCMYRDNRPARRPFGVDRSNWILAGRLLAVSDSIRALVHQKAPLEVDEAKLELTPGTVNLGQIKEGSKAPVDLTVKNLGKGSLRYHLVPDCSCFSQTAPANVAPGETAQLRTLVNTSYYVGEVHKLLVLYSNDPNDPVHEIPVQFFSVPPGRLYRPEGDTVILPTPGGSVDVLFLSPNGTNLKPTQFQWNGVEAKATMEPWNGNAADELLNEPVKHRSGYVFHLKLGKLPPGRSSGTLSLKTADDAFPDFSYTLYFQKGIIASPADLFLGDLTSVSRGSVFVSRPKRPFKIVQVSTGIKSLKATVVPTQPDGSEYRVDLIYDGTAPQGDFLAEVDIRTDDPAQPHLRVTVRGTVL